MFCKIAAPSKNSKKRFNICKKVSAKNLVFLEKFKKPCFLNYYIWRTVCTSLYNIKQINLRIVSMKNTRFTCAVLLFLLFFIRSTESYQYHYEQAPLQGQCTYTAEEIPQFSSSDSASKDLDIHYTVKKKIKYRATTLDSSTLKAPYHTKLVHFTIFKDALIYGLASAYQIQRHTHLHLYQLF